jgi:stearoyl-CoA desaturase (delta-9 desaturase)
MDKRNSIALAPWLRPWWKPLPEKAGILAYLVLIHGLAIAGLVLFPLPGPGVFGWALLLTALGGLGTTVCYHRALAHRSLKLNTVLEPVMILLAIFNGSGAPRSWVAYHRHHHSKTDTEEDVSSPQQGGFWWAHLRWLYQSPRADSGRWCPELQSAKYRFWSYAETPLILLSLLVGLLWGWQGFFWIGAIRLVYSLHMQCFVNSLTHLGRGQDGDFTRNVWWLGPLQLTAWGENWHRNHHSHAGSARFGLRWWQPDIGWYFILAMEAVGLASNVREIPRARA